MLSARGLFVFAVFFDALMCRYHYLALFGSEKLFAGRNFSLNKRFNMGTDQVPSWENILKWLQQWKRTPVWWLRLYFHVCVLLSFGILWWSVVFTSAQACPFPLFPIALIHVFLADQLVNACLNMLKEISNVRYVILSKS